MYRILLSTGGKAYAYNLGDNCTNNPEDFTEQVSGFVEQGDVIVLVSDLEDAQEKLPEYDIEEVFND